MNNQLTAEILLFASMIFILGGFVMTYLAHRSRSWRSTSGVVTKSHVSHIGGGRNSCKPVVEYEFQVNGEKYRGRRLRVFSGTCFLPQFAKKKIAAYPEGRRVNVYFNPSNTNDSVLIPGISGSWVSITGMFIGGFLMMYLSIDVLPNIQW